MGKHTKADGTDTQNGKIPVVTPSNMGKGLYWDENTKQYMVALDPNVLTLNDIGQLSLRISALEDNQLKIREDGIYQGGTARPDLANLYVSNNGNDSNPGTRDAPLRTIQEAFNRLEDAPVNYYVWLHEGHQFEWVYLSKRNARIDLMVYGPTVDSTYPEAISKNAYYRGYTAKNFPRPTVNVRVNHIFDRIMRHYLSCTEIAARGIRFNIYNRFEGVDDGSVSGSFNGMFDAADAVTFHGCILNEVTKAVPKTGAGAYRDDVVFRTPIVRWIDSLPENMPYFVSSSYTSQVSLMTWNHDTLQGMGEYPDHEALIKSATAFRDMSKGMKEKMHDVEFDEATKTVFGLTVNWDIFANS